MNMNSCTEGKRGNDNHESPQPDFLDVEDGLSSVPSSVYHQGVTSADSINQGPNNGSNENQHQNQNQGLGDLMFDGHDLTKTADFSASDSNNEGDHQSCQQPGEISSCSVSLTPSLRAAAPVPLRSSRRLNSLPGAFRMGLGGVATPAGDVDDFSQSRDDTTEESVGFQTHNAHEVLIEATLVTDRSIATTDEDGSRRGRPPDSTLFAGVPASNQPDMALVEAKPMNRFACLCDMLGNWKAICFIILVIIAIAAVAFVSERNRQISPEQNIDNNTEKPMVEDETKDSLNFVPPSESNLITLSITDIPESGSPTSLPELSSVQGTMEGDDSSQSLFPTSPSSSPTVSINKIPEQGPTQVPTIVPTHGPLDEPTFIELAQLPSSPPSLDLPLLSILPKHTLTALEDLESPQSLALEWIIQDPFQYVEERLLQRFVLATVYYALDGSNWANNTHWLSYEIHECEWYSDIQPQEAVCLSSAEEQQYQAFVFDSNGLEGTLPKEMWLLSSLSTVSLSTQDTGGTLPDELEALSNIETLALRDISLSGPLPTGCWRSLQQLKFLRLDKNDFQGSLPSEIGGLESLRQLYLNDNLLTGAIASEIGNLAQLEQFILDANSLSGTIPTELGLLTKLQHLYISHNKLTGSLPNELINEFTSTSIQTLVLGNNMLSGGLPTSLGLLTDAHTIDLFGNRFTGMLPSELGLLRNVSALLFESNSISGPIPTELGLLTKLSALILHNNDFTGTLPEEICALKRTRKELVLSVDCWKVECECGCSCDDASITAKTASDFHRAKKLP